MREGNQNFCSLPKNVVVEPFGVLKICVSCINSWFYMIFSSEHSFLLFNEMASAFCQMSDEKN